MGRPKLVSPTAALNVHIDAALKAKLDQALYSELDERIPQGAYQRFFNLVLHQALVAQRLDLSPFLGTDPGQAVVRGDPATIARLKQHLEQQ